jgi:hypothetical protein
MFEKIKGIFSQPDADTVIAYQYKLPRSINVDINKDDGHFVLHVDSINDEKLQNTTFYIEADSVLELVELLNDSLLDYLDFPDNIKSKMPKLLPPKEFLDEEGIALSSFANEKLVFAK